MSGCWCWTLYCSAAAALQSSGGVAQRTCEVSRRSQHYIRTCSSCLRKCANTSAEGWSGVTNFVWTQNGFKTLLRSFPPPLRARVCTLLWTSVKTSERLAKPVFTIWASLAAASPRWQTWCRPRCAGETVLRSNLFPVRNSSEWPRGGEGVHNQRSVNEEYFSNQSLALFLWLACEKCRESRNSESLSDLPCPSRVWSVNAERKKHPSLETLLTICIPVLLNKACIRR